MKSLLDEKEDDLSTHPELKPKPSIPKPSDRVVPTNEICDGCPFGDRVTIEDCMHCPRICTSFVG